MSPPTLVFGAGGIGTTADNFTFTWGTPELVSSLLSTLKELGLVELDSAASYPSGNPWNTETLLGQAKAAEKGFIIDTKIRGSLNDNMIPNSIDKSLSLLGIPRVRTLHAHMPDKTTPIEITAAAFDKEYKAGKFERLGLSNYNVEQLEAYFAVCEEKGYVKPTVYQGHYNALSRNHETELIPLLRKHGPLAGGFLTGKVTFRTDSAENASGPKTGDGAEDTKSSLYRTRWEGKSEMTYYTAIYGRPVVEAAFRKFKDRLDHYNAQRVESRSGPDNEHTPISLTEASLRWLLHHSALKQELGDGAILGAKREEQLKGNVDFCRKGPLPDAVLSAIEEMWEEVKEAKPGGRLDTEEATRLIHS